MAISSPGNEPPTLARLREVLYSAVVADACDACGFPRQSPRVPLRPLTSGGILLGRCKTTLWAEMAHRDPRPYELELVAVDGCRPDDVLIGAAITLRNCTCTTSTRCRSSSDRTRRVDVTEW